MRVPVSIYRRSRDGTLTDALAPGESGILLHGQGAEVVESVAQASGLAAFLAARARVSAETKAVQPSEVEDKAVAPSEVEDKGLSALGSVAGHHADDVEPVPADEASRLDAPSPAGRPPRRRP